MPDIKTLYEAGMHAGLSRARRHPAATPFIFTSKDRSDVFDLEITVKQLDAAAAFVTSQVAAGRQVLFVSGKNESSDIVKGAALRAGMPYVAGRWIGGTLTNFKNIRKRIDRLERLTAERESGALDKYTKKERLLLGREIEELLARFGGLVQMTDLPAALFIVDTRHEDTAVKEANQLGIPVVALANSDCDFSRIQYPIAGNDTSVRSVGFVCDRIAEACGEGKKTTASKHHHHAA